jgi:hypothetical protein
MKLLKTFILLFALSVSFISCDKDDDDSSSGSVGQGTMTAKIDGTNFSNSNNVGQATLATLPTGDNLIIQASNSDGKSINLVVWNYTGAGTYEINSSGLNPNTGIYTETDISNPTNTQIWQAPYQNSSIGTIKITEETSSAVKGEFNFMAKNASDSSVTDITEGFFNLEKP